MVADHHPAAVLEPVQAGGTEVDPELRALQVGGCLRLAPPVSASPPAYAPVISRAPDDRNIVSDELISRPALPFDPFCQRELWIGRGMRFRVAGKVAAPIEVV